MFVLYSAISSSLCCAGQDIFTNAQKYYDDGQYKKAFELWHSLAKKDDVEAQVKIALMYSHGQGIDKDPKTAVQWVSKAAKNGHKVAQYYLGNSYEHGQGVEKNLNMAFKWYQLSAKQGYPDAEFSLGVLYENGSGVEKDYKKAVKLYFSSANKGSIAAQTTLAYAYENGYGGFQKDIQKAIYWYEKAAKQGDSWSKERLKELKQSK